MSSFITKTKITAASIPNASAGKVNEFVDTDGVTKSKDESGAVEIYSGTAAVAAHVALSDPHPQYLTPAEGNAAYDALGSAATVQSNLTNHLNDTSNPHPQYTQPTDAVFINPQIVKVKTSDAGLNEFTSLSLAIASITDADPITKPYVIEVGAGVHTANNPLVLPTGVSVRGAGINATTIKPQNAAQHLFVLGEFCEISFLNLKGISGSIGSGKAAIYCEDVGNFGQLHKLSIYDFDIGIENKAVTADSILYVEYVDINGDYTYGIKTSSSGGFINSTQLENTYTYESSTGSAISLYATGLTTELQLFAVKIFNNITQKAIVINNGVSIKCNGLAIQGAEVAIEIENIGSGCTISTLATSLKDNVADYLISHPNSTGSIFGGTSIEKTTIDPSAQIAVLLLDTSNTGIILNGDILYSKDSYASVTDISQLITNTPTMGLINGGVISAVSGLSVSISAGLGYQMNGVEPNDILKRRDWDTQSLTIPANSNVFVYMNDVGTFVTNAAFPDTEENILIGRVVTNASSVTYIEKSPMNAHHFSNRIDRVFREAIGAIYATGSLVSESGTRNLDVTAGEYYYSEAEFLPAGGTAITWDSFYQSTTPGVYTRITGVTTVDNGFYDNGSGTLQAIPSSKHVKHLLMVLGGPSEKYILIYGTAAYNTLAEAQAAPLPVVPSFMNGAFARVASIIVQHANANIQDIIDERPRVGFASSSSVGGVTDHGALSGLGDDDHTQYILVNGSRAYTGSQSFGGNNITSVGTVNGVTVEAHASRHLPNGADPLTTATPVAVGSSLAVGTANSFARADHVHTLPDVGTANTYGAADLVPVFTTDAKGRITTVVNTAISILAGAVSDFASAVRSTVLTGLSIADSTDVVDTDTVLQGIGKLQAQNNLWTNLVTTTALTNSSNATLTSITELQIPVTAGKKYRIEGMILYRSTAATTGLALTASLTGAVGTLALIAEIPNAADGTAMMHSGNITSSGDIVVSNATPAANLDYMASITGIFVCTTSGTLTPQFRSETNGQTITVQIGSNIISREF
jgi:hypothetical protein